jgi:CO/xanthine dehydrogenase FAD-binding subunit
MNPFRFAAASDVDTALATVMPERGASYIAGGTNILDLI